MNDHDEFALLNSPDDEEGPMPFELCPTHGGVECEQPCPCRCDECEDPEINE